MGVGVESQEQEQDEQKGTQMLFPCTALDNLIGEVGESYLRAKKTVSKTR